VAVQESQIKQLESRKQDIAENCELEHITLPMIADPMETESSIPGPYYDFSELNRSLLQDKRSSDREKFEVEFKQKMDVFLSEIERTAPNLKARDQYEALQEKEKVVTEEFEAARKEEKQIADAFNTVKQKRYCCFYSYFLNQKERVLFLFFRIKKLDILFFAEI